MNAGTAFLRKGVAHNGKEMLPIRSWNRPLQARKTKDLAKLVLQKQVLV